MLQSLTVEFFQKVYMRLEETESAAEWLSWYVWDFYNVQTWNLGKLMKCFYRANVD